MALPSDIRDREEQKFVEDGSGNVAVRTTLSASGLSGAGTDGSVTLTGANTWVQVPGTVPTSAYVLVITKETETGTIRWSFSNGGTPSATNGNKFTSQNIIISLAANQAVYCGSTVATDVVNWTAKVE